MLLSFAKDTPGGKPRIIVSGGDTYATAVAELDEGTQSHPRLAMARPLAPTLQNVQTLRWLLWAVPVLVALAVLLSFMRPMTRPIARPGETE
jgi:flagellar biosynthesis/type III secretory pathway M-ring protein FliF/YscJ